MQLLRARWSPARRPRRTAPRSPGSGPRKRSPVRRPGPSPPRLPLRPRRPGWSRRCCEAQRTSARLSAATSARPAQAAKTAAKPTLSLLLRPRARSKRSGRCWAGWSGPLGHLRFQPPLCKHLLPGARSANSERVVAAELGRRTQRSLAVAPAAADLPDPSRDQAGCEARHTGVDRCVATRESARRDGARPPPARERELGRGQAAPVLSS